MDYESLLIEADTTGLTVKEKPLDLYDGRILGRKIAIRQDIPTREKHGDHIEVDGYTIMFEPSLAVIEKIVDGHR